MLRYFVTPGCVTLLPLPLHWTRYIFPYKGERNRENVLEVDSFPVHFCLSGKGKHWGRGQSWRGQNLFKGRGVSQEFTASYEQEMYHKQ